MAITNPLFDEVSATTIEAFVKGRVARTLFTATPWLRVLRTNKKIYRPWQGGSYMKVPFDLQPVPSGAYAPGTDTFTLQQLQTTDDMAFAPKFYNAEIVILATYTDVYNREPYQIVNILKEKYGNGSNSIDSKVAADWYNHGQASSSSVTSGNRIKNLNGIAEALNDGYTPSWTSDVFTNYGNQLRNGPLTGTVLNSIPYWGGDSSGAGGVISNQILNRVYNRCKQGKGEGDVLGGKPDYGLCSDFLYGCISDRVFPMQRVDAEIKDPHIGLNGLKFNNGVIFPDSYSPGLQNAIYVQDKTVLPSITTGTFTVPTSASTNLALSNFPATGTTGCVVGELFNWLRSDTWRFSYPKSGRYAFRPRGLQEAFDGDILADIIRAAMVVYCLVPASNQQSFGYIG
jgi:hypothetical protein